MPLVRLALLPLALLAACSVMPRVRAVTAAPDGVIFEFPVDQQAEATRQAMLYCANLGRTAMLNGVKSEGSGFSIGMFDCR